MFTQDTANQPDVIEPTERLVEMPADLSDGSPVTVRQMSVFQENYNYAKRVLGYTHIESKCYAIDYHRKFTARECTEHFDALTGGLEDESVAAFDHVLFNELVAKLDSGSDQKQVQFLYLVIRQQDLERHLNKHNLLRCIEVCGTEEPEEVKDIARAMGFAVRANGSCNSMARYRRQLQGIVAAIFPGEATRFAKAAAT
jgi:hypothetical protein